MEDLKQLIKSEEVKREEGMDTTPPATSTLTLPEVKLFCNVCGGPDAAFHYSGLVCHSCRVFFVRTIQRAKNITCKNGDFGCDVTFHYRGNCPACRYKKCLEANMCTAEVGKFGQAQRGVVRYFTKNDYITRIKEIYGYNGPRGFGMVSRLENLNLQGFLRHMVQFEKEITNLEGTIPTGSQVNANISLADLLLNPEIGAPRETAAWNTFLSQKSEGDYSVIHLYTRMCVYIADFLGAIAEFNCLPAQDKLKLAQYHIGHIGSLDNIFYQYKFGLETANNPHKADEYTMSEKDISSWKERCACLARYFDTVTQNMTELAVTHEEILLMKLIMIFNTPIHVSEKGKDICRKARGKYQQMLAQYVLDEYPLLNKSEQIMRIASIMDIFKHLKDLSEDAGQKYVIMIKNNIGGMGQQLPIDVRVRVFQ